MKKILLISLITLAPLLSAEDKDWVTLYNGKDLRLADHRKLAPAKGRLSPHPSAQRRKRLATLQCLSLEQKEIQGFCAARRIQVSTQG